MSDDSWLVSHSQTDEWHYLMHYAVERCKQIFEDVEDTLKPMPEAIKAKGLLGWDELKTQWYNNYNGMVTNLLGVQTDGHESHEWIKWADDTTVRIVG